MSHPGRPNSTLHPYAGRYPVHRTMPEHGDRVAWQFGHDDRRTHIVDLVG